MTSGWRDWLRFVAGVLAGFLAGCGDGPASNVSYKLGPQVWDFFVFAAKDGPVLVIVDGNPLGMDEDAQAEAVAASMGTAFSEPFIRFTIDPAAAAHPEYRMIWTMNPAPGYDMNALCGPKRPASAPLSGRRLEMRVGFCQGDRLVSAVHGWMPAQDSGPDSADWRNLIAQMARQLVSTEGI
jgi:hypothetical protein